MGGIVSKCCKKAVVLFRVTPNYQQQYSFDTEEILNENNQEIIELKIDTQPPSFHQSPYNLFNQQGGFSFLVVKKFNIGNLPDTLFINSLHPQKGRKADDLPYILGCFADPTDYPTLLEAFSGSNIVGLNFPASQVIANDLNTALYNLNNIIKENGIELKQLIEIFEKYKRNKETFQELYRPLYIERRLPVLNKLIFNCENEINEEEESKSNETKLIKKLKKLKEEKNNLLEEQARSEPLTPLNRAISFLYTILTSFQGGGEQYSSPNKNIKNINKHLEDAVEKLKDEAFVKLYEKFEFYNLDFVEILKKYLKRTDILGYCDPVYFNTKYPDGERFGLTQFNFLKWYLMNASHPAIISSRQHPAIDELFDGFIYYTYRTRNRNYKPDQKNKQPKYYINYIITNYK